MNTEKTTHDKYLVDDEKLNDFKPYTISSS